MNVHRPVLRSADRRAPVDLACTCRWVADDSYPDTRLAVIAHRAHVDQFERITFPEVNPGDLLKFDRTGFGWTARATAATGRYVIATAPAVGRVVYTVIDRLRGLRGPLDVSVGTISSLHGEDPTVTEMVASLEGRPHAGETDVDGWDPNHPPARLARQGAVPAVLTSHDHSTPEARRAA